MINLLPYDTKRQTQAARINVILFRYIIILGFSASFIVLACLTTYFFINFYRSSVIKPLDTNISSDPIQKQADSLRTNLATSKNILDQQVSYSDVVTGIAAVLPAGTILNSLSINDGSFGATTDLQVLSSSAENEIKLKENFELSKLFSNYKFQSTTPNQGDSSEYPFTINVSITINKAITQ